MDKQKKEQLQAACALNLCTVSVSQIVDYDNLYVMEQEYDAILNNLDLEKIFKDDSLLDVIEQILKTITYFKMEDVEKKIIEREYQQQMKNAIWSSVPNFGFIIASRKPLHSIAISLAFQVGIGYMNYRKNKNQYAWDKEKKMLKLQQAAMEQLNGLRFELFKAAWELEEKNNYPDEYRLTEKQLKEYNEILKDSDPIRKYRRLNRIKNNFKAYPPFWYFLGSTANCVANTSELREDIRAKHKEYAIEAFKEYRKLCEIIPLREDPITSSFALEYADILISDLLSKNVKTWKEEEITAIKNLIDLAEQKSQHSYDVLELCLIAFLRINDRISAKRLLEHLIDEDYNKIVNAQLLSSIYVQERDTVGYYLLQRQVGSQYLFPMPEEGQSLEDVNEEFIRQQKEVLRKRYWQVIDEMVEKYSIQWNKIFSTFDCDMKYEDSFFANNPDAECDRVRVAKDIFSKFSTRNDYVNYLRNLDIELKLLNILNDSYEELFSLPSLSGKSEVENDVKSIIEQEVRNYKNSLKELMDKILAGSFGLEEYKKLQDLSIKKLYVGGIKKLKEECDTYVNGVDREKITEEEGKLRLICNEKKISYPEIILLENSEYKNEDKRDLSSRPFSMYLFGPNTYLKQKNKEDIDELAKYAKQYHERQDKR